MLRIERLLDGRRQLPRELCEINLIAQALAQAGQDALGIVSTPIEASFDLTLPRSSPQLVESRSAVIPIERECITDSLSSHDGEAGGVDKRVLALVTSPQPIQRLFFYIPRNKENGQSG